MATGACRVTDGRKRKGSERCARSGGGRPESVLGEYSAESGAELEANCQRQVCAAFLLSLMERWKVCTAPAITFCVDSMLSKPERRI